jgi:hypothetical protein
MVRSRTDLFDFSASALLAGGITSMVLFLAGLAASHGGATAEVRGPSRTDWAPSACRVVLGVLGIL